MDSYSGRFPLDFISFCLGMTTEAQGITSLAPDGEPHDETSPARLVGANPTRELRPSSNFSSLSEAAEESLSTYAERTMKSIIAREGVETQKISSLLPPLTEQTVEANEANVPGQGSSGEYGGAGTITPQIFETQQVAAVE